MVIFSHGFVLSYGTLFGREPLNRLTKGQATCGVIAVDLFFLISGMLITASWFRSKSMSDFLLRRVLRIYPGFIVALGFSSIVLWIMCPDFRQHVGLGISWLRNFLSDTVWLDIQSMTWPGTFAHNPFPGSANGSLWTIQREFFCYLLVAVIGLFSLFKRRILILGSTACVGLDYAWRFFHTTDPEHLHSRFFAYFLLGMTVWLFRDKIRFSLPLAIVSAIALIVAARLPSTFSLVFLVAGSYLALFVGLRKPWRVTRWTEKTDLSYGVYLYAWPVQQVVAMFPSTRSATANLLISIPVTLGLAFLSWHFVERRFLKMKAKLSIDYDPALPHLKPVSTVVAP
jgi:peptidoglycan/LPS O-acetylase OafA/YrhL